jgi:hypothetical protein
MAGAVALVLAACFSPAVAGADGPPSLDRYEIVHGCYALRSEQTGQYVKETGNLLPAQPGYAANAATPAEGEPFRMQATDLGRYLFFGTGADFLAASPPSNVAPAAQPSDNADWTVNEDGNAFRIINEWIGMELAVDGSGNLVTVAGGSGGAAGLFTLDTATGCAEYPEVEVNVNGPEPSDPIAGSQVSGLVETHMHQMAFEFLGTKAHCGRPWHRFGAPFALEDCDDHQPNGCGAVLEGALQNASPCHDPGGWPSFAGWPRHNHYTHEQSYYKWLERSWRGGLRVFVNLAVENRVLCEIYPLTPPPSTENCNEMDTVRRELDRMEELERYIDAQSGGPGKGWYRLVESPEEARQVINDGKLAVIRGMEVSEPFDCRLMQPGDVPTCDEQAVIDGIQELWDRGVRQLELVNKFDNALTGVAGDGGTTGSITSLGNFYSAGTFWDLEACEDPANHDHSPTAPEHNDDAVIGGGLELFAEQTDITLIPAYGPGPHCNQRGLTDLGALAIEELMEKGMIFDPDHMSVIARNRALDIIERNGYPGVMTSHSWSTDNALPRISAVGGLIGPSAKSPNKYVDDWEHLVGDGIDTDNPYLFGLGFGADMNGFAAQGGAPGVPITYPFQSPVNPGITIDRQQSGQFTFDYNVHGTAHYGLYPDWAEGVRLEAESRTPGSGAAITEDMTNAAEAYIQMWERTTVKDRPTTGGPDCKALRAKLKKAKKKKAKRKLRRKLRKRGC